MRWISSASATGSSVATRSRQYQRPGRRGTFAVTGCARSASVMRSAGIGPKIPGRAFLPAVAVVVVVVPSVFPWAVAVIP